MIIQSNFTTVQLSPYGAAPVGRVNLFIDVDDLPEAERSIQHGGGLVVYYGTDGDALCANPMTGVKTMVLCPAGAKIDKAVKEMQKSGRVVFRVIPADVKETTFYAVDYNQNLLMQVGDGDVVPAISEAPKSKGKKRARKGDGKFQGDDPSTPEDEAWESGES